MNWTGLDAIGGSLVPDTIDNNATGPLGVSNCNTAISFGATAEISSASPFNLVSGFFNSLNAFNLNLEVQGFNGHALMYDPEFTLAPTGPSVLTLYFADLLNLGFAPEPSQLTLNLDGVTDVRFTVSGGEPVRFDPSGGAFAMDNLTISTGAVPEPGPLGLISIGAPGLGGNVQPARGRA